MNRAVKISQVHKQPKEKPCKALNCKNTFIQYNSLQKYCSAACKRVSGEMKAINKVSAKRKVENKSYSLLRKAFLLKNPVCPVTGEKTTQVHHKKGRIGNLFLDVDFWLAVSKDGHRKIEDNPDWAKVQGYSLDRNGKEN